MTGTAWGAHHLIIQNNTYMWMGYPPGRGLESTEQGSCGTDGGFVYTIGRNGPAPVTYKCDSVCPETSDQTCEIMIPPGGQPSPDIERREVAPTAADNKPQQ